MQIIQQEQIVYNSEVGHLAVQNGIVSSAKWPLLRR